ncbi:hypothetical protein JRO89_XS08G0226100 [Xanthoceras sorbifolium]|uniref:Uncharacterized protein n=1 Tax=Xanthoceras sorbifolium TaxID=99658 RepID=A0ABQ8HR30_9ROSI|nr:hypothetical protein JRO89_XS08G0226100 [Xanthoceras sorbifolium]
MKDGGRACVLDENFGPRHVCKKLSLIQVILKDNEDDVEMQYDGLVRRIRLQPTFEGHLEVMVASGQRLVSLGKKNFLAVAAYYGTTSDPETNASSNTSDSSVVCRSVNQTERVTSQTPPLSLLSYVLGTVRVAADEEELKDGDQVVKVARDNIKEVQARMKWVYDLK